LGVAGNARTDPMGVTSLTRLGRRGEDRGAPCYRRQLTQGAFV